MGSLTLSVKPHLGGGACLPFQDSGGGTGGSGGSGGSGGKDHPEVCRELSSGYPGYQNVSESNRKTNQGVFTLLPGHWTA